MTKARGQCPRAFVIQVPRSQTLARSLFGVARALRSLLFLSPSRTKLLRRGLHRCEAIRDPVRIRSRVARTQCDLIDSHHAALSADPKSAHALASEQRRSQSQRPLCELSAPAARSAEH